ncbi:hypothetical protein J21TS7_33340 [Paenibacillus cineris]|uniref:Uncharacterized protein n=1 Tax=Paenibacillus cineris TaxID=237530 RepID=A0ABQ4LEP4_9BACL|nr:hypothetical protein J21TS7_33340 [Paenibacillus cineris]
MYNRQKALTGTGTKSANMGYSNLLFSRLQKLTARKVIMNDGFKILETNHSQGTTGEPLFERKP